MKRWISVNEKNKRKMGEELNKPTTNVDFLELSEYLAIWKLYIVLTVISIIFHTYVGDLYAKISGYLCVELHKLPFSHRLLVSSLPRDEKIRRIIVFCVSFSRCSSYHSSSPATQINLNFTGSHYSFL